MLKKIILNQEAMILILVLESLNYSHVTVKKDNFSANNNIK